MAFLAAAAPILSMVGAASSVGGSVMGAMGSAASNKANAGAMEWAAGQAQQDALFEERQQRRDLSLQMGEANALGAASGVDVTRGTPLIQELDRAKQAELQALYTRYQGKVKAEGYLTQGALYQQRTPYDLAGSAIAGTSILSKWAGSDSGQGVFAKIGSLSD